MSRHVPSALWASIGAGTLLFLLLSWPFLRGQSATMDEVAHIGAAVSQELGGARLNREHPPLTRFLAARGAPEREPALSPPAAGSPAAEQWRFGRAWIHGGAQAPVERLAAARTPLLLLAAALIPVAALWAHGLAGAAAAAAAALLAATSPLWIAHGTLVTTDAAMALFFLASSFFAWASLRGPAAHRRRHRLGLAASAALGMASKYSMVAGLAFVGLSLAWELRDRERRRPAALSLASLMAGAVLGVCFGWGIPPHPGWYLEGLAEVGYNHPAGYSFYAFGNFFEGQDPSYLLRAMLVKAQPAALVLAALGGAHLLRTPSLRSAAGTSLLWLPPLAYGLLLSLRAPAIGVRYALPALPFLLVLAGVGAAAVWRHRLRWLLLALAVVQAMGLWGATRSTPLAWFNGLGGCTAAAWKPCLDDSNVDWGQSLPTLSEWRSERYPDVPLRLGYFGSSPPEAYVDDVRAMAPTEYSAPYAALYAVSVQRVLRPKSGALSGPGAAWVRVLAPDDIVGGVYAVWDLREAPLPPPPAD